MSNKAIFLDRDNTLIEDPGYINNPDQVKLLDGVPEALIELKSMGYKLIVVSNQSGVARGIVTEKTLGEIHNRLKQLLAARGAHLDQIYYCPYHPDGVVAKYRKESNSRKPNPGMLLTAADEMDLDLSRSWLIGNSPRDIEAGLRAGCKTILINHPSPHTQPQPGQLNPDHCAVNIKEAVNIVKKYHRASAKPQTQTQSEPTTASQTSTQKTDQPTEPQPAQPPTGTTSTNTSNPKPEQLLSAILDQLKTMQRTELFSEFSIMRLLAGIVQIVVLFCLLTSLWLLMSPQSKNLNAVFIALGFATVFQLMALTFYMMQERK